MELNQIFERLQLGVGERGLVVAQIGPSLNVEPQRLRHSLLFWDRLYVPALLTDDGAHPDLDFLSSSGVLVREYDLVGRLPQNLQDRITVTQEFMGVSYLDEVDESMHDQMTRQFGAFTLAERQKPGAWALCVGFDPFHPMRFRACNTVGRGSLVELTGCIPVPDKDVPLAEILEFKRRRSDELIALRAAIESLYAPLTATSDYAFVLLNAVEEIDRACADAIKVAREARFPFRLSDMKVSFKAPVGAAIVGLVAGHPFGMPMVGALLGSIAGMFAIGRDIVPNVVQPRETPYRYVMSYHRDLFV